MKNKFAGRCSPKHSALLVVALAALALVGCRQDMHNQAKFEPFEKSDFFANGSSARMPVAHTVARGSADPTSPAESGENDQGWLSTVPYVVDEPFLRRGQQRFDIFCAPCHDSSGTGNGMIVQRGFKQPPSYHEQRLRDMPIGYFFNVATHGYGLMSGYKAQVKQQDRWAIAAWVRVLQRSQSVPEGSLSGPDREQLQHDVDQLDHHQSPTNASSAHAAGAP